MNGTARVTRRLGVAAILRLVGLPLLVATLTLAGGCGKKTIRPEEIIDQWPRKPSDVVVALEYAYKRRDVVQYAKLLASDFQFWFDPATRPDNVPEFWTRLQDSTGTANLFAAGDVSDIRITLTFGSDVPVNLAGRERWRKIRVTDTFLEVDKVPLTGEVITFRVDGDVQDFYLRRGFTPDDTLAGSRTAKEWYLVEWHDLARLSGLKGGSSSEAGATAEQSTTWSLIKSSVK